MSTRESVPSRADAPLPAAQAGAGERDSFGRFRRGNRTSRRGGNPRLVALAEAQQAIARAFTGEDVVAALRALHTRALAGDVAAASVFVSRIAGPPRQLVQVDVPAIVDGESFAAAVRGTVAAVTAGELALETGERLVALLAAAADATVVEALDRRVAQLEGRR